MDSDYCLGGGHLKSTCQRESVSEQNKVFEVSELLKSIQDKEQGRADWKMRKVFQVSKLLVTVLVHYSFITKAFLFSGS